MIRGAGRGALLGDAAYAVSLIAGKGATLALAGAVVLADALANRPRRVEEASTRYEARLRPWAEAALRLAARPFLAASVKRLLNRGGERLWEHTWASCVLEASPARRAGSPPPYRWCPANLVEHRHGVFDHFGGRSACYLVAYEG